MFSVEEVNAGKALYSKESGNHPTIHCNRFPAWGELSDKERKEYILKAKNNG